MRYANLAIAAGASLVVAAKLSPAYALPPVVPLDLNGPMRQGNMCKVLTDQYGEGGYGYGYFRDCEPQRHARHQHRESPRDAVYAARTPDVAPIAIRPAVYRPLDLNGPVRQGNMCKVLTDQYGEGGYGYGYFRECEPHAALLHVAYHHRYAHHGHHHRHADAVRHHHRKHDLHHARHHRHAQDLTTLSCDAVNDIEALQQVQQFWQPSYGADTIELIAGSTIDAGGEIEVAAALAPVGEIVVAEQALQDTGGLLAQLFAADLRPAVGPEWTTIAQGPQVTHSMLRTSRAVVPPRTDDRPAPIEPVLSPATVLGHLRSPQPQLRHDDADADHIPLTSVGYSTPIRSDTGGAMPIAINDGGVSPIAAAMLGLALILAAPLALVVTHLTVAEKAAVIDTVSDPVSETEWYIPAGKLATVERRTAWGFSVAGIMR
jgi:hypothetical protein